MIQQKIRSFNENLVKESTNITIVEYVKRVNELYYNIDISYIDDFIDLVDK